MYQTLDVFRVASAMARHAGSRQALTAQNVANADTPGYRALELPSFREISGAGIAHSMRASRPGHLVPGETALRAKITQTPSEPSPNGNTVSIEDEMMSAIAISREHNRALAVYRHGMTVLRTTLGR